MGNRTLLVKKAELPRFGRELFLSTPELMPFPTFDGQIQRAQKTKEAFMFFPNLHTKKVLKHTKTRQTISPPDRSGRAEQIFCAM